MDRGKNDTRPFFNPLRAGLFSFWGEEAKALRGCVPLLRSRRSKAIRPGSTRSAHILCIRQPCGVGVRWVDFWLGCHLPPQTPFQGPPCAAGWQSAGALGAATGRDSARLLATARLRTQRSSQEQVQTRGDGSTAGLSGCSFGGLLTYFKCNKISRYFW